MSRSKTPEEQLKDFEVKTEKKEGQVQNQKGGFPKFWGEHPLLTLIIASIITVAIAWYFFVVVTLEICQTPVAPNENPLTTLQGNLFCEFQRPISNPTIKEYSK